jgi:hypothetical protein
VHTVCWSWVIDGSSVHGPLRSCPRSSFLIPPSVWEVLDVSPPCPRSDLPGTSDSHMHDEWLASGRAGWPQACRVPTITLAIL